MNISNFFSSYVGMYIAQAFCHSLIAALIVDRAIQAWGITNPVIKQRFSLIVMIIPIFSFPLYQIINPERGSISFRLEALFDINRWLNLELWGKIPLNLLFILMLSITTLVFLFQEMIPILRHTLESRESSSEEEETADNPLIHKALENFPGEKSRVSVIDDDEFILFSTTGKSPTIFLSSGLVEALDTDQLQAAIAHEIAHITRNRRPLLVIVYIIRLLMFFNPVVLVEFRRIVQEEEKICDDIAVSLTQKPHSLAETLKKFSHKKEDLTLDKMKKISNLSETLEEYSHNMHIESRVMRLKKGITHQSGGEWFKFLLTLTVIIIINYFIV
ncbi:MAG: M56 family metallopeptidase [Nitrospirae bacterium]|nr:M56 family metallopeptidase [Nitrospirota bacterium]